MANAQANEVDLSTVNWKKNRKNKAKVRQVQKKSWQKAEERKFTLKEKTETNVTMEGSYNDLEQEEKQAAL